MLKLWAAQGAHGVPDAVFVPAKAREIEGGVSLCVAHVALLAGRGHENGPESAGGGEDPGELGVARQVQAYLFPRHSLDRARQRLFVGGKPRGQGVTRGHEQDRGDGPQETHPPFGHRWVLKFRVD